MRKSAEKRQLRNSLKFFTCQFHQQIFKWQTFAEHVFCADFKHAITFKLRNLAKIMFSQTNFE
jgi:hypothetical protein